MWSRIGLALIAVSFDQSTSAQPFGTAYEQAQRTELKLIPTEEVPKSGTFWLAVGPSGQPMPPFPCPPSNLTLPTYDLGNGQFLIDDSNFDYVSLRKEKGSNASLNVPSSGDEEGDPALDPIPDTRRNYEKFMNHSFLLLDTNAIALTDSNLYNACVSFPDNTNTAANLQIASYGTNAVIVKANHFDYSAESRDFALLISDTVDRPTWKSIDFLGASDSEDGWLVQGTVPNWEVTDTMFFLITNVAPDYTAFFKAIPYSGPVIEITGAQPYDVVSNTMTLTATVLDLSGVTNVQFNVNVDGPLARYTLGASNVITIDTRYNPNDVGNVYITAFENSARVYNPTNPPDKAKLFFSGSASIPLDFDNETYLLFASDNCSPDVGTNYIYFSIDQARYITATISDPSNGQTIKSFAGNVPYAATVSLSWNFTGTNGVTAYTNDTYKVTFTASNSATLTITNRVVRGGVRPGAGCLLTYQWEDPANTTGSYLNSRADYSINGDLKTLYQDIYRAYSLTWYSPTVVGTNRNLAACYPYYSQSIFWRSNIINTLTNVYFSEFTIAQAHGSGATIGGGDYLPDKFDPADLLYYVRGYPDHQKWRLRKAALWTCYSGDLSYGATAGGQYINWFEACGMLPNAQQDNGLMYKNCGLFFAGKLPQGGFGRANSENKVTCEVAAVMDQTWVCGLNQYPGGCDPTYSFRYAVQSTINRYVELTNGIPVLIGFKKCVYSSIYDDELRNLNTTHVKRP